MLFIFVDALLPLVSNVNITDRAGRSSLHHAAYNGHAEVGANSVKPSFMFVLRKN